MSTKTQMAANHRTIAETTHRLDAIIPGLGYMWACLNNGLDACWDDDVYPEIEEAIAWLEALAEARPGYGSQVHRLEEEGRALRRELEVAKENAAAWRESAEALSAKCDELRGRVVNPVPWKPKAIRDRLAAEERERSA